jgi:Fe-S cluster assembly protein SufD
MTDEVLKDVPLGLSRERIEQVARQRGEPEWHIQRRLEAWERFLSLPLPSPKQEDWRYTDITTLHLEDYPAVGWRDAPKGERADATARLSDREPYDTGLSPCGVRLRSAHPRCTASAGCAGARPLRSAPKQPEQMEADLGRLAPIPGDKLTLLHAAAWDSGLYVYLPPNVQVAGVIEIIHWFETPGLHCPHTMLVCEQGSAANIVQSFFSPEGAQVFVLGAVEVFNKPNSDLRHAIVQRMGRESLFISSIDYEQRRDSRVLSLNVGLGARLGRTVLQHLMVEPGAEARPLGLFFGDGAQHLDFRTLQDHRVGNTTSDLLYKGALYDEAVSVFSGMIRVHPKAQHTDAYQANRNLLLSENAQAYSIPNLEIGANEVRCTHGATIGPIQPDEVFYLRSRGIDPAAAEALIVMGFFEVVLREIKPSDLRLSLQKLLASKLKGDSPRYFMDLAELEEEVVVG